VMAGRYAGKPATGQQLELAQKAYDELTAQLRPAERMRWLRRRMISGLGPIDHIP